MEEEEVKDKKEIINVDKNVLDSNDRASTSVIGFCDKVNNLETEPDSEETESDSNGESYKIQVESLEKTVAQLQSEVDRLNNSLRQQNELSSKKIDQVTQDFTIKIERLTSQCDQAVKDRENMVMKYAVSENGVINLQKQIKQMESKTKQFQKEKEAMESKIKSLTNDKAKLTQVIDVKNSEIMNWEREVQKKKDELHAQSSNLKFFQNKLKLELEGHKETQSKLEKTSQRLREAKEETEQVRRDAQDMLRNCEPTDEESKQKHNQLLEEFNQLCIKVQNLEVERLEYEQIISKYKQTSNQQQQNLLDLQACRAELESTKVLLTREQERAHSYLAEAEGFRQSNVDLQAESEACRQREAELLAFTQKLTERNVAIQAELTFVEAKARQLDLDFSACQRKLTALEDENNSLKEELSRVGQQREDEKELLSRHLAEQTTAAERLAQELKDQIGENQLIKKKHLTSMKELTRELQSWRRRGEAFEAATLSHGSSSTSLDIDHKPDPPPSEPPEVDKQRLIEKIVAVQRSNAKKQEKIDFLQEHTTQLVSELQRKTRLIQALALKQPPAALTTNAVDQNKADLAKHGGIMASLYNSKPVDDNMTLELSLEINQKLQAALEDTLLKNITLKENMETLGNEIARLTVSRSGGRDNSS